MYWSKYGLLGFFEMTPRMATSLFNVFSDVGPSDERAVMMTLITPAVRVQYHARLYMGRALHAHFMR